MNLAWNSGDILIVVISIALITRFQQFNNRVWNSIEKDLSEDDWRELRTHYGLLVDLTRKTDRLLSNFIFLSCSNNLYFICTFLFHIGWVQNKSIWKELPQINKNFQWWTFSRDVLCSTLDNNDLLNCPHNYGLVFGSFSSWIIETNFVYIEINSSNKL